MMLLELERSFALLEKISLREVYNTFATFNHWRCNHPEEGLEWLNSLISVFKHFIHSVTKFTEEIVLQCVSTALVHTPVQKYPNERKTFI